MGMRIPFDSVYSNKKYQGNKVSPSLKKTNSKYEFTSSFKHLKWQTFWLQYILTAYTEKTSIPFPFKLNEIWSWWQFSFRFWTKWISIWFRKSNGKPSPRSYPIQFERKWNHSFLSVHFSLRYILTAYNNKHLGNKRHFHVFTLRAKLRRGFMARLGGHDFKFLSNEMEMKKYQFTGIPSFRNSTLSTKHKQVGCSYSKGKLSVRSNWQFSFWIWTPTYLCLVDRIEFLSAGMPVKWHFFFSL